MLVPNGNAWFKSGLETLSIESEHTLRSIIISWPAYLMKIVDVNDSDCCCLSVICMTCWSDLLHGQDHINEDIMFDG